MAGSKHYIWLLLLCFGLFACEKKELASPSFVIEGWIEDGKAPVVMAHKSFVLDEDSKTSTSLQSIITGQMVIFGRVAIFDGTDSVILTGRVDTNYMPPYIYTTTEMDGVAGKQYTLVAHYQGFDVKATTTIPAVAKFDSIHAHEILPGQMRLTGYISGVENDSYYMLMAKKIEERQFKLCPLGVISGEQAVNGKMAVTIYCPKFGKLGITINQEDKKDEDSNMRMTFPKSDTQGYSIKLARIDYPAYLYWEQYAAQSTTQGVLFMSVYKNLPSNIDNGLGVWYGMGSSEYHLRLTQTKTFIF